MTLKVAAFRADGMRMGEQRRDQVPRAAPPAAHSDGECFTGIAALLWEERELLGQVLFKLVEEHLIAASGDARWLAKADAELRIALRQVEDSELIRAAELEALARRLGASAETTLRELGEQAPEPWAAMLVEHRDALRALLTEIETVSAGNRRLLLAGSDAARETLERIGAAVTAP